MVRPSPALLVYAGSLSLTLQKAVPIHGFRVGYGNRLPHRHSRPYRPAPAPSWDSDARFIHTLRPMAYRPHRDLNTTLRSFGKRKHILQHIQAGRRDGAGDYGMVGKPWHL